jgi:flavin-dependent dehydrogenase
LSKADYTVAVIGGGPAGAVAAQALARSGIKVLLASAKRDAGFQVGESLVPAARNILERLGVWKQFQASGHLPCYGNSSAWGSSRLTDTDFIRSPYGPGWHLDRMRFDEMLCQVAEGSGAVRWNNTKLLAFERQQAMWRLTLQTPTGVEEASCQWLVDCTGRNGYVAKGLEVKRCYEDHLLAFFAHCKPDESAEADQDSRTLVESVPQGWFHTALLPSAERIVTFFTDAATDAVKQAKSVEGFSGLIEDSVHLSSKLKMHGYVMVEKPQSRDARSSRLSDFHGEGWLAAGDAATAYDPLSSQGILFSLYSGLKAGEALTGHLGGNGEALPKYDAIVANVYEAFLVSQHAAYRQERRWPQSPFWMARL